MLPTMLSDREIEASAAALTEYQQNDRLSQLLKDYSNLIQSYKRLKSDYEEEREAREKYKQMAKDQERNPFALVLVDGDGYIFNDSLLSQRADGGSAAAQMINEEIKASLRQKGLEHCHVMVRVYGNVLGLSKALAKANLSGLDARSLAPFIANFNRAYGLTDFVDAGALKENADFKLRELLRLYAENSQCKHIYFAACHDVGYISELTPHSGNAAKFTLVRSHSARFHDEFYKLGLPVEELRVFRNSPLNIAVGAVTPKAPVAAPKEIAPPTTPSSAKVRDRNGPIPMPQLPSHDNIPRGFVAVNKKEHRLDPTLTPPDPGSVYRLRLRVEKKRVCHPFQLYGTCNVGNHCKYDHEPVEEGALSALEAFARSQPCPKRGACRNEFCTFGHICQLPGCNKRGGSNKSYCKLPPVAHQGDLEIARFVPAVVKTRPVSFVDDDSSSSSTIGAFNSTLLDEMESS